MDCGIFLLLYAEIFIQNSDRFVFDRKYSTRGLEVVLKPKRRRPAPKKDPEAQKAREKAKAKKNEEIDTDWRSDTESADTEESVSSQQKPKKRKTEQAKGSPKWSQKNAEQWVI